MRNDKGGRKSIPLTLPFRVREVLVIQLEQTALAHPQSRNGHLVRIAEDRLVRVV